MTRRAAFKWRLLGAALISAVALAQAAPSLAAEPALDPVDLPIPEDPDDHTLDLLNDLPDLPDDLPDDLDDPLDDLDEPLDDLDEPLDDWN